MGTLVARTAFISRCWSIPLAQIWRTVERSLSSGVFQFRSYSDQGLDDHVLPCQDASPTAQLSGESPPGALTTPQFRAYRSVDNRYGNQVRKDEGCRIQLPSAVLEFRGISAAAFTEAKRQANNDDRSSRNVAQDSSRSPRQSFVCRQELVPFGSTSGRGNIQLASPTSAGRATAALRNRQQQGLSIELDAVMDALKQCSQQKDLIATRQLHDCIIQSGMHKHPYVATTLLNAYIKCGRLSDAHRVFDGLEKTDRNVITWNVMIGAYSKRGSGVEAYRLFLEMKREGFEPNAITYMSILNAAASAGGLEWVKDVHSHALKAGLESDLRVCNALIHMYAKTGSIHDSRLLFDRMEKRNVVTWTAIIGAYAEGGSGVEAYRLFLEMKQEGFEPNAVTYMSILNAAASAGALEWVKDVHSHALKAGLESDLRVCNALIHMYAKTGSIDDARLLFDRMDKRNLFTWNVMIGAYAESGNIDDARVLFDRLEKRDVITWNTMIGAYSKHGCGMEAYGLFHQMQQEGFTPNTITYLSILNASASAESLEWVKEVHSHALKAGLESDLPVCNALIHMYAKTGSIHDARLLFDRMEQRNVVTWTAIIGAYAESGSGVEAYRLFLEMKREGFEPNAITYMGILNATASAGALEWVKEVHSHALKAGLESDWRVCNALIHMYAKTGSIDDARLLFDRMEKRNVVTWSAIIGAYAENGSGMEAYRLFLEMQREGFEPNAITYMSILNAAASAGSLEWVKEVHSHALKSGLESDWRVCNALIHMYAKTGSIDDARLLFDRIEKRNAVAWGVIIGAYAEGGFGMEAYQLFLEMEREGFEPNAVTYLSILNAAASSGALEWVKEVHSHALKAGLESDLRVCNALIHMYAKAGSIDNARLLFDRMEKRDVVTWTVIIGGFAQHGFGQESLNLFRRMNENCVEPDDLTLVAVLTACSHAGLVDDGRRLFSAMKQDYGIEPDVVHYNCMVDILGRAGHLEEAKLLVENMPVEPNAVTWTALLGACRTHRNVDLGELAAEKVFKLEPTDASAYVLLSNIYAATGKWEKVVSVRNMMQERGVRKEPGRSWIEVDGKIHEFVVGDTSHPEAKAIYSELEKLTEQLKAKGYIPDTKVVLHNIDEEEKELVLCSHSEKLAIAYGLLRIRGGKPVRVEKNLRVCPDCHAATKLISEVTGREIIVRDAIRFHHFKDGVCSCGDYW